MALTRSEIVDDCLGVLHRPVGMRPQNIVVDSAVVHQRWLLSELLLVIESINLPRLGVCTISFLLNLVRSLSVGLLMSSCSECDARATLSTELGTVEGVSILVDVSADLVGLLSVHKVKVIYLLVLLVVFIERVQHLLTLLLGLAICSIVSALHIHVWVVSV